MRNTQSLLWWKQRLGWRPLGFINSFLYKVEVQDLFPQEDTSTPLPAGNVDGRSSQHTSQPGGPRDFSEPFGQALAQGRERTSLLGSMSYFEYHWGGKRLVPSVEWESVIPETKEQGWRTVLLEEGGAVEGEVLVSPGLALGLSCPEPC